MPPRWSWMETGTVHPLTGTESDALEALFQLKSSDPVPIRVAIGSAVKTVEVTSSDLNTMTFTPPPGPALLLLNREVDDADLVPGAAFWTDTDWTLYEPQTSTLIADAHRVGRTSTGISVFGARYTIALRQFPTQTRHDTGKTRPVYIPPTLSDHRYPPLAYGFLAAVFMGSSWLVRDDRVCEGGGLAGESLDCASPTVRR